MRTAESNKWRPREEPTTYFASGGRAPAEELDRQTAAARGLELLQGVLAAVPDLVMILNRHRQVVFANAAVLEFTDRAPENLHGLRPGEVLGCARVEEGPQGCGTAVHCRTCGVVGVILEAQAGGKGEGRAHIPLDGGETLSLDVRAHTVESGGERLTVLTLADRSDEERREVLERLLFDEILPDVGGVRSLSWLLRCAGEEEREEIEATLEANTRRLVGRVRRLHLLTRIERGDYTPRARPVAVAGAVRDAADTVSGPDDAFVYLEVAPGLPDATMVTDPGLLRLVLHELVANAVEASGPGRQVTLGADVEDGQVRFWVHNPAYMGEAVRQRIFQRAHTTRGDGRGLGTYAVQRCVEGVLGGRASFVTSEEEGTTFTVALPRERSNGARPAPPADALG